MSGNSFLSHHPSPLVESLRLFREHECEYLFFHGDVFVYFPQHLTFRVGLIFLCGCNLEIFGPAAFPRRKGRNTV